MVSSITPTHNPTAPSFCRISSHSQAELEDAKSPEDQDLEAAAEKAGVKASDVQKGRKEREEEEKKGKGKGGK